MWISVSLESPHTYTRPFNNLALLQMLLHPDWLLYIKEVLFPACTEPNGAKLNQTERCWNEDHLTSEDKQPGGNTEVERLV